MPTAAARRPRTARAPRKVSLTIEQVHDLTSASFSYGFACMAVTEKERFVTYLIENGAPAEHVDDARTKLMHARETARLNAARRLELFRAAGV